MYLSIQVISVGNDSVTIDPCFNGIMDLGVNLKVNVDRRSFTPLRASPLRCDNPLPTPVQEAGRCEIG